MKLLQMLKKEVHKMAFQKVQSSSSIDTDEILISMMNKAKSLEVLEVGEFKHSNNQKEDYKYFYVTFKDVKADETFKLSYNVKVNEDNSIYIGQGAKIYPILSHVSQIKDEAIVCFKEDIDEALNGLSFKAKSVRRKFGRKPYFVIVPISEGDE